MIHSVLHGINYNEGNNIFPDKRRFSRNRLPVKGHLLFLYNFTGRGADYTAFYFACGKGRGLIFQ